MDVMLGDSPVTHRPFAGQGHHSSYSVVVLAGGLGVRLGAQDKASVLLDGETLLERVLCRVSSLTDDIIIAQRDGHGLECLLPSAPAHVRIVRDVPGHVGVLAGMRAGLAAARHEWSFVVACDMPFVQTQLVQHMWLQRSGRQAVVPRLKEGLEPLHSFYHVSCLSAMRAVLDKGRRRVTSIYDLLQVRYVDGTELARYDPQHLSFININTPLDLERAQELLASVVPEPG